MGQVGCCGKLTERARCAACLRRGGAESEGRSPKPERRPKSEDRSHQLPCVSGRRARNSPSICQVSSNGAFQRLQVERFSSGFGFRISGLATLQAGFSFRDHYKSSRAIRAAFRLGPPVAAGRAMVARGRPAAAAVAGPQPAGAALRPAAAPGRRGARDHPPRRLDSRGQAFRPAKRRMAGAAALAAGFATPRTSGMGR